MFLRIRKSTDDSWHLKMLKNFITSGYHKNLPLWVLEAIHDYFCVYFMYFSKIPNRLGICIFMTAVTEAVPCLFSHCSCSLHAIFLLCLSPHKQTNSASCCLLDHCQLSWCQPAKDKSSPAIKTFAEKWCSSASSLSSECQQRHPLQAELPKLEPLEEFSHFVNVLLLGIK